MAWISIRNQWPNEAKKYCVRNCLHNHEGTAFYNGFDWEDVAWEMADLFLYDELVTHWQQEDGS